ncbi:MAG: polysaccharide deacetylase family protein [Verrucomicrobiota bacterium]
MSGKKFIVSLHDYHQGSHHAISEQIEVLNCLGVKNVSLLIIPNYHRQGLIFEDSNSLAFLEQRLEAGDDLVLHGFYHLGKLGSQGNFFIKNFYTANEGEFWDLTDQEFSERLEKGMFFWKERNWPLDGFIAPAWLLPKAYDLQLSKLGFHYTTRLNSIELLQKGKQILTQSLCYSSRAGWRRLISRQWNPYLLKRLWANDVIRLSLHPNDLAWTRCRAQIIQIVEMILARGYQPLTYAEYAKM